MHETEDKGCYNCKYRTTPAHWPPCDECPDNENWEASGDMTQEKKAAVRALWVVVGALREAAERLEQVQSDQGHALREAAERLEQVQSDQYTLHARQLRVAAGMAEGCIKRIEREIRNSKLEIRNWQEEGKIIGWILDEDDGYCD